MRAPFSTEPRFLEVPGNIDSIQSWFRGQIGRKSSVSPCRGEPPTLWKWLHELLGSSVETVRDVFFLVLQTLEHLNKVHHAVLPRQFISIYYNYNASSESGSQNTVRMGFYLFWKTGFLVWIHHSCIA